MMEPDLNSSLLALSKTMYIACIYNLADTKWDVIGVREQDVRDIISAVDDVVNTLVTDLSLL